MKFAMRMNILICGFSGSGKSTLLKQLEKLEELNSFTFIDLDQMIIDESDYSSIEELVNNNDWDYFRAMESDILKRVMLNNSQIIALGGGSLNDEILNSLDEHNCLFWLDTPFALCYERIQDSADRPLVKRGKKFLTQLYSERLVLYQKGQRFQTVEDFLKLLNKYNA